MLSVYKELIPFLVYPLISLVISLLLTRLCVKVLPLLNMMDYPGGRHIHDKPVPLGGGLAIITAFVLTALIYGFSLANTGMYGIISGFASKLLMPGIILIIGGIIDDKFTLKSRYKLAMQLFVCILCWYSGVAFNSMFGFKFYGIFSFVATIAWMFAFINAFNLIDGLDGLAAGLGIVSAISMGIFFIISRQFVDAVLMLCLGAACLGFLRYNFYPARIFMGDTGSMFIGFIFGVIGIITSYKAATVSAVLIPFLAAGIPMFDGFLAIWRRGCRNLLLWMGFKHNKNPEIFVGDVEHLHHRILKRHGSQRKTTLILYFLGVVSGFLSIVLVLSDNITRGMILVVILLSVISAIRRFAGIELWDSTQIALLGLHKPRKSLIVSLLHPVLDVTFILCALIITLFLFHGNMDIRGYFRLFYYKTACSIVPIVLILNLTGIYRIYWLRASANNYIYLMRMILWGACIGFGITYFVVGCASLKLFIAEYSMFYLLITLSIIGERMLLRHMDFAFKRNMYLNSYSNDTVTKVIVYGGGLNTRFYLSSKDYNITNDPVKVIGIVDDEPVLRRQLVYNCKVLGSVNDLPKILIKHKFNRVVITSRSIPPERRAFLEKFCDNNNISLSEAYFKENDLRNSNG